MSDLSNTVGTQLLFASAAYNPGAVLHDLRTAAARTDVLMELKDLATLEAGASAKADLTATWAPLYAVHAAIEMDTDPVTGTGFVFYWAPSVHADAGQGNPGFVTGSSAEYSGGIATLAEGLALLQRIGVLTLPVINDADGVAMGFVGNFRPTTRYGCLVAYNATADATFTDSIEMGVSFTPVIPQST